jgi:fructose-1,6-bisphosphatase-3
VIRLEKIYPNHGNGEQLRYLKLLSKDFPSIAAASSEIINLSAILELPKGTDYFMTDLHGEAEAFSHILNNASGNIKVKLQRLFKNRFSEKELNDFATLIYYPELKIRLLLKTVKSKDEWYEKTLKNLVEMARFSSHKYTRSKVRKALPKDFQYIIDELVNSDLKTKDKEHYYDKIIRAIIDNDRAEAFIVAICDLIKRLTLDSLHIIGDLFDRGPSPDIIVEKLIKHHSVDIQWGNHDALWMGAAAGSGACICNVLNNAYKSNTIDVIEDSYGINLMPLAVFANATYEDNMVYHPKEEEASGEFSLKDVKLYAKMRKAILIIMFKLEGQIILKRPDFNMNDRLLLDKIDYKKGMIKIGSKTYSLLDHDFPTINPKDPYKLTKKEEMVVEALINSFKNSEKLQNHIKFIYKVGSMYKKYNNNLLYHGHIPIDEKGNFMTFTFKGKPYFGKSLYDYCEVIARQGYYSRLGSEEKQYGEDFLWWLWCGKDAPTVGRTKITTFERTLIKEVETHAEPKNAYYKLNDSTKLCDAIFQEFGFKDLTNLHIINGHMPVNVKKGESPIKAKGKMLMIDGGFSRSYHQSTGIAGYTLVNDSYGIRLAAHQPFKGFEHAISENVDIESNIVVHEDQSARMMVADTDTGKELKQRIADLKLLISAYQAGMLVEKK